MSQEKEELKKKYEELYQKKAYHGWDEEKLQELIENFGKEDEVTETEDAKKADPVMDFEIDPEVNYEFELQRRQQARHNIPTEATIWCPVTDSIRKIRYCRTEDSPYVDEQSEGAKVEREQIKFNSKTLIVSGSEEAKIRYLLAYDANGDKEKIYHGNTPIKNLYKLKDKSAEDKAEVERFKQVLEAGKIIEGASITELRNFMRSRFGEKSDRDEEILKVAYQKAQANPALFTGDFTNPKHKIKSILQQAVDAKLIVVEGNQVKHAKTNVVIQSFDADRHSFDEALARWIIGGDKDAKEFFSQLESKL